MVGDAAGRLESVRTAQEVVGLVSDRLSRLECKMKSRVAIGITTTMEYRSKWFLKRGNSVLKGPSQFIKKLNAFLLRRSI